MKVSEILLEDKVDYLVNSQGQKVLNTYQVDRGAMKPRFEGTTDAKELAIKIVSFLRDEFDVNKQGKFLQWLVNNYIKGMFSLEDHHRVRSELEKFIKVRRQLEQTDINKYTENSLADVLDQISDAEVETQESTPKELRKGTEKFTSKQIAVLYNGPDAFVVTPHVWAAAKYFGSGTSWCTVPQEHYFDSYNKNDPMFILIDKKNPKVKYQLHFHSSQIMDTKDRSVDFAKLVEQYPQAMAVIVDYQLQHRSRAIIKIGQFIRNASAKSKKLVANIIRPTVLKILSQNELEPDSIFLATELLGGVLPTKLRDALMSDLECAILYAMSGDEGPWDNLLDALRQCAINNDEPELLNVYNSEVAGKKYRGKVAPKIAKGATRKKKVAAKKKVVKKKVVRKKKVVATS